MSGGGTDGEGKVTDGAAGEWPDTVELRGVTESVVTTLGPNDLWNVAALGLHAGEPVTARTWGRTRTWRNFRERGEGVVQFTRDACDFVDAACSVREESDPVLESADAWVRVDVTEVEAGEDGGTEWVDWELRPTEHEVRTRVVPTTSRGHAAVVEATVAASRLDVPGYDRDELLGRLAWLESVVETAGGEREREAFSRLREHVEW
jgi:hypothetical protein